MMFTSKKSLAVAIAGAFSLGATAVQAVDFNASTTLQNTLAVTVLQDFDIGTVFATDTGVGDGTDFTGGVGGFVISPIDGTTSAPASVSASVSLTSISTPTPAQGSVDTIGTFNLQLPNTVDIDDTHFVSATAAQSLSLILAPTATAEVVELAHESGNTAVPSLYMMHFTLEGVSDGTAAEAAGATTNDGAFTVTPGFGVSTYIFNIGATVTTKPTIATTTESYQEGIYSGTFEVTANY